MYIYLIIKDYSSEPLGFRVASQLYTRLPRTRQEHSSPTSVRARRFCTRGAEALNHEIDIPTVIKNYKNLYIIILVLRSFNKTRIMPLLNLSIIIIKQQQLLLTSSLLIKLILISCQIFSKTKSSFNNPYLYSFYIIFILYLLQLFINYYISQFICSQKNALPIIILILLQLGCSKSIKLQHYYIIFIQSSLQLGTYQQL